MESRIVILYKIREAIFAVKHDQQHLNLQIACITSIQSASAFRMVSNVSATAAFASKA
jgi:hypothetical protein